jgi:hypothetical protein
MTEGCEFGLTQPDGRVKILEVMVGARGFETVKEKVEDLLRRAQVRR